MSPRSLILLLLALTLAQSHCTQPPPPPTFPQRSQQTILINNLPRTYLLHLPRAYDGKTKLPLIMLIHGANDTAEYAEEAYNFVEKIDTGNFLLIIPESNPPRNGWDAFSPAPNADLDFLLTLLTTLPKTYAIDPARIYLAGHSSGACMTYRLAAEQGNLIAAAAIVAGSVGNPPSLPTPITPVPLLLFHGKEDPTIPYSEMPAAIQFWLSPNHASPTPTSEQITPNVTRETYPPTPPTPPSPSSTKSAPIVAYTLTLGNHMWPGGKPMPGKTQLPPQDIPATDLILDFFKKHPK